MTDDVESDEVGESSRISPDLSLGLSAALEALPPRRAFEIVPGFRSVAGRSELWPLMPLTGVCACEPPVTWCPASAVRSVDRPLACRKGAQRYVGRSNESQCAVPHTEDGLADLCDPRMRSMGSVGSVVVEGGVQGEGRACPPVGWQVRPTRRWRLSRSHGTRRGGRSGVQSRRA